MTKMLDWPKLEVFGRQQNKCDQSTKICFGKVKKGSFNAVIFFLCVNSLTKQQNFRLVRIQS